jgi:hypothetical protein
MKLRVLLPALALAIAMEAGAQTFKCRDAAGKITYSSQDCAGIGLKSAGEVHDKINVSPGYKAPVPPKPPAGQAKAPPASPAAMSPAEAEKKAPERRCFTVKTAKGVVTRCNDTPEDDAKK